MSRLRTLDDVQVEGRKVFLRVDFNVPLDGGEVADDFRIRAALPTIRELRERGAMLVIGSHLGRPNGEVVPSLSLEPAAARLAELLEGEIIFTDDCVGEGVRKVVGEMRPGAVTVLENLRFHSAEKEGDASFASRLAEGLDLYVSDAFGVLHRDNASVTGVPRVLKDRAAGRLVEREIASLARLGESPVTPYVAVLGGAKVSDKIGLIKNLMRKVNTFCIGGAMAYTFLRARGVATGASRVETDKVWLAKEIMEECDRRGIGLLLPSDHIVAEDLDGAPRTSETLDGEHLGLDIGPSTRVRFAERIAEAGTVLWNGPMGLFEREPFAAGTRHLANAIADSSAFSVIGGGDSAAAVRSMGLDERMGHVSTGGGATLTYLSGKPLPGLKVLEEDER